jgi:hypothetical protein
LVDAQDATAAITAFIGSQPGLSQPLMTMRDAQVAQLGKTVSDGVRTLVGNFSHNKYLYSILLTGLVEKLVHPEQDIRNVQVEMPGGYSNRQTDQNHITPFLKRHNLKHCAASGMESGRNFERPFPHGLDYSGKAQGKGNREA